MEGKVLLYDPNDVKIGETYIKRARQLVKQQRALWVDDSHTSIRFVSGVETLDAATSPDENDNMADSPAATHYDDWLIELAAKRISQRKRFIFHSIAVIPGWFILFGFTTLILNDATIGAIAFVMFMLGSWVTGYAIHACQFAIPRFYSRMRSKEREERKARVLEIEVANLKAELQRQGA